MRLNSDLTGDSETGFDGIMSNLASINATASDSLCEPILLHGLTCATNDRFGEVLSRRTALESEHETDLRDGLGFIDSFFGH